MRNLFFAAICILAALICEARTVATGTVVANPGATVVVPVTMSDMGGVSAAVVALNYDPTVVVCLGAEEGNAVAVGEMTYADSGSGRFVAVFSSFRKSGGAGELVKVRFSVRDGTQGLYSDVTLADVQLGAVDGVSDVTANDPLVTVNGMIRVMAADAAATRLEEKFTVWPETRLRMLALADGDGLMASDGGAAIVVGEGVTAARAIPVSAPPSGWRSGSLALLTTPTEGLAFVFPDFAPKAEGDGVSVRATVENGVTTYWADVTVKEDLSIVAEMGTLDAATAARIRQLLSGETQANPAVGTIVVKGDAELISVAADLGIAPAFGVVGTTATATYTTPKIRIIAFDPATGRVRMKVEPGEGNAIRSPLVTGCIHVYGTSDLKEKMRYIAGTGFDLAPYLKDGTKGEADLTVALGTHTFIKIKAEQAVKQEGEEE